MGSRCWYSGYMIAYKYRFHGHGSLRYLYAKGSVVRGRILQLRYTGNRRRVHSRVTVIVSKKVVKSAVKRNRIRRRMYEILRRHWDNIVAPTDMAFTVFAPEVGTMPAVDLEMQVLELLKQANLYHATAQSDKID